MITAQFVLGVRVALGVVLAVAAMTKLAPGGLAEFTRSLERLGRPPAVGWRAVAGTVAAIETCAVMLLALPATALFGLTVAAVLLTTFAAGIARVVRRGRRVPCRCFGAGGAMLGRSHAIRNGGLAGLAVLSLLTDLSTRHRPIGLSGTCAAVLLGACAAALIVRWDDIAAVLRPPTAVRR